MAKRRNPLERGRAEPRYITIAIRREVAAALARWADECARELAAPVSYSTAIDMLLARAAKR